MFHVSGPDSAPAEVNECLALCVFRIERSVNFFALTEELETFCTCEG